MNLYCFMPLKFAVICYRNQNKQTNKKKIFCLNKMSPLDQCGHVASVRIFFKAKAWISKYAWGPCHTSHRTSAAPPSEVMRGDDKGIFQAIFHPYFINHLPFTCEFSRQEVYARQTTEWQQAPVSSPGCHKSNYTVTHSYRRKLLCKTSWYR